MNESFNKFKKKILLEAIIKSVGIAVAVGLLCFTVPYLIVEIKKINVNEFFVLQLSFLGWIFLSLFTCGIGLLWVIPYMDVTIVKFYEYVAGVNKDSNSEIIDYN